ncbi:MAG: bifunctional precorrin-2 dehydrogenase/sirohydrochlorin ferrochelatase [Lachnospiraceae bacterium]|nr:bifunctional precorrin-2 dehydrogenase/sirohydrochlorin ferrochelatase [Lachnospiraceae bacterium]
MEIAGKNGVIVGGGKVAARKVEKLLAFGPNLTVIAPQIEECIRNQEMQMREDDGALLLLIERAFRMEDLENADFVIAATDDEALNVRISDYCKKERVPVNVVDDKEKCSFYFPALIREGDMTIGISTDGKSPVAASWMRKEVSRIMPQGLGEVVDLMGQIRPLVMESDLPEAARKEILEKVFLYCMEREGKVTLPELVEMVKQQSMSSQHSPTYPNDCFSESVHDKNS